MMTEDTQILAETGAKEEIGIVDEPLEKRGEDSLKIKKYSNALVTFIKNSLTPMTIGIQGSWGSGKTSLLNTIYAQLDDANEHVDSKDFKIIWINSWENSLMATPEEALIKIINEIINGLNEVDPSLTNIQKVKDAATVAAKGILRVGAGILGGQTGGQVVTEVLESTNSIKQLREQLSQLVNAIRESNSQRVDKIVIFVDDLDRVDPPEAVKILELLKNIFNIPGCIFVLAIDYDVVIKGLKDKFGERTPENEYEFRAFFDKIIQLPFLMPVQNYDIGNYVNDLLRKIGFQDENIIDTEFVNQVVDNTIGGNPRTIKRLINSLALIKIVNDEDGDEQEEEIASDEELLIERKLLFALVCLQIASSDIYSLLNKESDFKKWDENLAFSITQKKEEEDERFEQNFASLASEKLFDDKWEQALYRVCYANPKERANAIKLSKFLNYLHEDLGSNSEYPLPSMIEKALGKTSVTSVVTDTAERAPKGSYKRNYAKGFDGWIDELNARFGQKPHKDVIEKLRSLDEVLRGPKFNSVDWEQGNKPEGFNIRYAGSIGFYNGGQKLGLVRAWGARKSHDKRKEIGIAIQILKNPERGNQIVEIGKIKFMHQRPIKIDREEKKIVTGSASQNEYMHANIPIDNLKDFEGEFLEILFLEAANTRAKMKDKILNGKLLQKYVDTFKNGRKDSKAWIEAADFLEEHFDEKNIVTIDL